MNADESEYTRERFEEEKREFEKQVDTLPNVPLDSLPDLYNFPELELPNILPERYLHGIDLLNAITCYNDIITLHYACVQCCKNSIVPLETLIVNEGADINMCNEYGVTAFECFAKHERRNNRINDIIRVFFKQVQKLKAVGLHVHPQNQRQYELILSRDDMEYFVDEQLKIDYNDELDRMNKFDLKEGLSLTLRDVFREEIDLTPAISTFKTMMSDQKFEQLFPLLWGLVKMRYNQIVTRQQWTSLITDALRILTKRNLPQNCVHMITKGLMNYDLANLLTVAFNKCLRDYRSARRARRFSIGRSPRKMLPRI